MFLKPLSALVIVGLGQLNYLFDRSHNIIHSPNKHLHQIKNEEHEDHNHGKKLFGRFGKAKIVTIKNFFAVSLFKKSILSNWTSIQYTNHIGFIFSNLRLIWYGC